jgi:hypothetical protein
MFYFFVSAIFFVLGFVFLVNPWFFYETVVRCSGIHRF